MNHKISIEKRKNRNILTVPIFLCVHAQRSKKSQPKPPTPQSLGEPHATLKKNIIGAAACNPKKNIALTIGAAAWNPKKSGQRVPPVSRLVGRDQ